MKKIILSIEGMTCSACSNGLEKYLKKQDKIKNANVNLVMATASIECDDNTTLDELAKYVSDAGFVSLGYADLTSDDKKESIVPFIILGFLAVFLMYISMSHMIGMPVIPFLNMKTYPINYSISLTLLTIPFLVFGFDIIKSGIKNLIHKMPNMDTLVSLGVIASLVYSIFGVVMVCLGFFEYVEDLYFESVAFVIYFIKLGRFIDKSAHNKTKEAIKKLVTVTPKYAKIKTTSGIKEITIDEVKKGDSLICLVGDKIAVDGVITEGITHTDESFITGESKPVKKSGGDKVIAGSINYDGIITYKAEKIGKDSTISEIVNLVIEATNTSSPISLFADKICSYFVPIIISISLLTLLISLILGIPFNTSLTRAVSVLVVACPCALGLATPLAIVTSVGVCAKNGILVKSSETLEQMSKINTIVFDKTGTLTNGTLTISEFYNYSDKSDSEVLSILGSLESTSTHPIAKGILNYINNKNIKYKNIETETLTGKGIKGNINNIPYYVGSVKIIKDLKIKNIYETTEKHLQEEGNSIIYIIEDRKIIGLVGVKDTIRKYAKEVIKKLSKMNIATVMLTGDNEVTAKSIGERLGINNIIAECLPKEKTDVIKKLQKDGDVVAMVGDGINDAPSLVSSDVGISISSGTDIACNAADVILITNNLTRIIDLINISKKTIKNIKENLFWAFLYNICMIAIATGSLSKFNITISPMLASASMILSSLFVAGNALRLKKIKINENSNM